VAGAAGVTAGGELGLGWSADGVSGIYRAGSQQANPGQRFTTLYHTETIGRRYHLRRLLVAPDPATLDKDTCVTWNSPSDCATAIDFDTYSWMESVLPWKTLNEDGEEMSDADVSCVFLQPL
jgi:hypothetical protein